MTTPKFLDLPPEIRNMIYHELLVVPSSRQEALHIFSNGDPIYPEVLRTCRKIYGEAVQILYGLNIFVTHPGRPISGPYFRSISCAIGRDGLIAMIRRYYIYMWVDREPRLCEEEAQAVFTGVDEPVLNAFFRYAYETTEYRSSDCKALGRASGKEKRTKERRTT